MHISTLSWLAVGCLTLLAGQVSAKGYDRNLMLCLVNKERVQRGLRPLGADNRLDRAAQRQADSQAKTGQMTHTGFDGSSPSQRIEDAGYDWQSVAENVAYGYKDEQTCMAQWMASPGHRANILNSQVTHFGSAVGYRGSTPYYTQDFAGDGKQYNFPVCPSGSESNQQAPSSAPSTAPSPPVQTPKSVSQLKYKSAPAPQPKYTSAPAPRTDSPSAPAPRTDSPSAPVPAGIPKNLPLNWVCIDKNSKGQCRRWKKCCINGRKWTCQEKWIGI